MRIARGWEKWVIQMKITYTKRTVCIISVSPKVSLSVFSLVPDLLFDYLHVLEYTKIRTVLQSSWELHQELQPICLKDDIYLKTSSKSNVRQTDRYIFQYFLERASISDFCCATNQNNPHTLKYVSYDRLCLSQPCRKFFLWAPPIPLGDFYPLGPPPPWNFYWPSVGGGGVCIFPWITHYKN